MGLCPLTGVWGCASFLSFLAPPEAAQKEKKVFRGHPDPRQRAAALCTPAFKKAIRTFQVPEKFGMTHTDRSNCCPCAAHTQGVNIVVEPRNVLSGIGESSLCA